MKATRKPLDVVAIDELGGHTGNGIDAGHHAPPQARSRGIMVDDAAALVGELKNRGLL